MSDLAAIDMGFVRQAIIEKRIHVFKNPFPVSLASKNSPS